jgi:hypothetical protein
MCGQGACASEVSVKRMFPAGVPLTVPVAASSDIFELRPRRPMIAGRAAGGAKQQRRDGRLEKAPGAFGWNGERRRLHADAPFVVVSSLVVIGFPF